MRTSALGKLPLFSVLAVVLAGGSATSAQTLRGRVEDAGSRAGIPVAEIVLLADDGRILARTQSDSAGAFVLTWRDAEKVRLQARRIGYEPTTTSTFVVQAGEVLTASVLLSVRPIEVDPLIIASRTRADERLSYGAGIDRRRNAGIGHFISREQIRASNSAEIAQVLRMVPGVRLRTDQNTSSVFAFSSSNAGSGMSTAGGRGSSGTAQCPMTIFLNGRIHRNPMEGVNILATWEIEAIEVYRNMTEVPSEFSGSLARCGVIAIWSARRL